MGSQIEDHKLNKLELRASELLAETFPRSSLYATQCGVQSLDRDTRVS